MNLTLDTHRKPWATWLALVLVCALLWAQGLGMAHRVVHGPQLAGPLVAWSAGTEAGGVAGVVTSSEVGWLAPLFAGHQGADCSTFDQLSHGHALAGDLAQTFPAVVPGSRLIAATALFLVRQPLRLQARGPPLFH